MLPIKSAIAGSSPKSLAEATTFPPYELKKPIAFPPNKHKSDSIPLSEFSLIDAMAGLNKLI